MKIEYWNWKLKTGNFKIENRECDIGNRNRMTENWKLEFGNLKNKVDTRKRKIEK